MKTQKEIKAEIEALPMEEWESALKTYESDERAGVKKLLLSFQKKLDKLNAEYDRIRAMAEFEKEEACGLIFCGIDEAGRGPLAGPVVAAAVIMPEGLLLPGINDSKKLTAKTRDELFEIITSTESIKVGVGMASPGRIDEINILQATYEAMRQAVSQLDPAPEMLINDAVIIPGIDLPQKSFVKGDARCYSIAAASIVAKVTRDRIMEGYDALYPEYGFAGHKGYGSAAHIEALKKYGPCPIHRRSFIGHFVEV